MSKGLTGRPGNKLVLTLLFSCAGLSAYSRKNAAPPAEEQQPREWRKGGLYEGYAPGQELLERRSRTTKVFKNSNGTLTSQTGVLKHYRDGNGPWQEVSYDIAQNPSDNRYPYVNVTNEVKSYFPANPGADAVKMEKDGMAFSWWASPRLEVVSNSTVISTFQPQLSGSKTVSNGKLLYGNVYPGISEEFLALEGGLENNTIINSLSPELAAAPADAMLHFRQFIPLQADWKVWADGQVQTAGFKTGNFSIQMTGKDGYVNFSPVVVFDQSLSREEAFLVQAPAEKLQAGQLARLAVHAYVGKYQVQFVNGGIEVSTMLPLAWLKQSGRSFPVVVDPVVTITPAGATGTFYGPMSHWYGFQRHADLYLQSEIGSYGIINSIEYNSTTTGTAGNKPTKIYMRSTPATTLSGTAVWNSATYTGTGAQLCLNANTDQGNTTGWKMLTLTSSYIYSQDNLLIMVYDEWGGSGSAKYYNIASTSNRQAYKRQDGSDPGDGTATAVESYLPEIRITYTPLYPPNNAGVTALVAPLSNFCSNSVQDVYVRVKNLGANAVNTTQVQWTVDGVPQTPVTVTTALPNYNDSVEVLLGSVFFATPGALPIKAWTYLPNGVADEDPTNDSLSFSITPGMEGVSIRINPGDTTICQNSTITLDAGVVPNSPIYIWSTGALSRTLDVDAPGTYSVKVQNNIGCFDKDTIHVSVYPNPVANSIAIIDNGDGSFTFNVIGAQNITSFAWDFNDGSNVITGTGLPGQVIHPFSAPGEYNVTLTLRNMCGEIVITRLVKVDAGPTGIDNVSALQKELKIFPNPGKETVTIAQTGDVNMTHIAVYNIMGQKIYAAEVKGGKHQINVSAFASGMYNVVIDTNKGNATKKLEVAR